MDALGRACARIVDTAWFQGAVVAAILANAVLLGLETYNGVADDHARLLDVLNDVFLAAFTVEIVIRLLAYGRRPRDYFRSGWNLFDFGVVALAYLPFVRESVTLLRVARILRVARLLSVLPGLRVVLYGLVRSIAPLASVAVLTFFLLYLYGMLGWLLFGDHDPDRFGDIGRALLTLFQLLTLEGWNEVLETEQQLSQWSWVYFVSFILVGSFLVLNLVIAIVLNSVEEAREEERRERRMARATAAGAGGEGGRARPSGRDRGAAARPPRRARGPGGRARARGRTGRLTAPSC